MTLMLLVTLEAAVQTRQAPKTTVETSEALALKAADSVALSTTLTPSA
jgi:hypothetical protein